MQKFVPRSCVGIFTPNAPDQPHWTLNCRFGAFRTIWVHSGPFGCLTKLGAKRDELVHKFVPRRRVGIFRNERTRSTPLDPNLMFWCLSYYLGAFGTVWLSYESRGKTGELVQKSMHRCRVGNVHNERTRSTPSDPKLMFWCVLYYLGAFGTLWLPHETQYKTGRTSAKVRATKLRRNFHTNAPDPPHWTLNCVLVRFVLFRCIRYRLVALRNSMQNGPN